MRSKPTPLIRPSRLLLAGYYGYGNLGDEAILAALLAQLRARRPDLRLTVASRTPAATAALHGVDAVADHDILGLIAAVRETDGVALGGGGLLADYWPVPRELFATKPHYGLYGYLLYPALARLLGKPCVLAAVGIGPLTSEWGRDTTRALVDLCVGGTVRDEASLRCLDPAPATATVPSLSVAADPAWQLVSAAARRQGDYLVAALRPWSFGVDELGWRGAVLAALATVLDSWPGALRLLPFHCGLDLSADDVSLAEWFAERLAARFPGRVDVVRTAKLSLAEVVTLIGNAAACLAMRYHAALFALGAGTPTVGLAYDPKLAQIFAECHLEDQCLGLDRWRAEDIAAALTACLTGNAGKAAPRVVAGLVKRSSLSVTPILQALDGGVQPETAGRQLLDQIFVDKLVRVVELEAQLAQSRAQEAAWREQHLAAQPRAGLEDELAASQAELARLSTRLAERAVAQEEVDRRLRSSGDRAVELEAQLARLEGTLFVRVGRRLWRALDRLAPPGSARHRLYLRLRGRSTQTVTAPAAGPAVYDRARHERMSAALELAAREIPKLEAGDSEAAAARTAAAREQELADLRQQLTAIHQSRVWRVADRYWQLRRRIGSWLRPGAANADATPVTSAAPPAADAPRTAPAFWAPPPAVKVNQTLPAVFVLPIIDWSFRFQRPQQLAREMARRGHTVFWLAHGWRQHGPAYSLAEVHPNIWEVTLRAPAKNPYRDRLDADALGEMFAALEQLRLELGVHAAATIVELPFWWPLAARLRDRNGWPVLYDCMDHHAGFSTSDPAQVEVERLLIGGADVVTATSAALVTACRELREDVVLLRNGCDFEHFSRVAPRPAGARPVIGYYGAIADWFDADLVADLAVRRPDWDFLLVGSTFTGDISRLGALANVTLAGEQPYAGLPGWLDRMDVLLLPFKNNALTAATNPVKVYEILAAGRPLVATPLPELTAFGELVRTASNPADFDAAIGAALAEDPAQAAVPRRAFARRHTWEERAEGLLAALAPAFPRVTVIIVTYNNLDLNQQCLESLFANSAWPSLEVIVADNGSNDGTAAYLQQAAERWPGLQVILNRDNRGFAAANNQGLAKATGDIVVFLNNDTVLTAGWLAGLVRHLRRERELGIVCATTNAAGNQAKVEVGYQSLEEMPGWAAGFVRLHDGELLELPMAPLFCAAVRRDVLSKAGDLDERFAVGMFEDDDFSRRIHQLGFRSGCARDVFVHHVQRASFNLLGWDRYLEIYRENQRRFEEKWHTSWQREEERTSVPWRSTR